SGLRCPQCRPLDQVYRQAPTGSSALHLQTRDESAEDRAERSHLFHFRQAMMQQMTPRERNLAMIVGTLVVGLAMVMLAKTFMRNYAQLNSQLTQKKTMLASMKTLITERELWVERDQYLISKQP